MHPNEDVIREILAGLASGDSSALVKHCASDIVFRLLGTEFVTPGAGGAYRGLAEIAAFSANRHRD